MTMATRALTSSTGMVSDTAIDEDEDDEDEDDDDDEDDDNDEEEGASGNSTTVGNTAVASKATAR